MSEWMNKGVSDSQQSAWRRAPSGPGSWTGWRPGVRWLWPAGPCCRDWSPRHSALHSRGEKHLLFSNLITMNIKGPFWLLDKYMFYVFCSKRKKRLLSYSLSPHNIYKYVNGELTWMFMVHYLVTNYKRLCTSYFRFQPFITTLSLFVFITTLGYPHDIDVPGLDIRISLTELTMLSVAN